MAAKGMQPMLVTTAEIRLAFKRFFDPSLPKLNVLGYQELPSAVEVRNFGIVPLPPAGLSRLGAPAPSAPVPELATTGA